MKLTDIRHYGRNRNLTKRGPGRIGSHRHRKSGVKVWRMLSRTR